VAELKRLQTIPDAYEITGGLPTVVEQIGNSVPPQLARLLALAILNQVFGVELPFDLPLLADNQSLDTRQRKPVLTSPAGERAKAVINRIKQSHVARKPRKHSYTAVLSENFGWTFPAKHEAALHIAFVPSGEGWIISVSAKSSKKKQGFEIVITPSSTAPWGLDAPQVVLTGTEVTPKVFTGVWKAFELELFRLGIKADLVQLCGYYQYPPTFQCAMTFNDKSHGRRNWKVVSHVVAGVGVGEILSHAELGRLWRVAESKVLHYAIYLRSLGYEVRNSNTNPQIPEGHILIPYAFPTLNQMSVQLHKSLERIYGES
jgi:DNA (cytosine-5)-methyltransferase 1